VIVTDASVLVDALIGDTSEARSLRERLRREVLAAPHVIDLEAANSLRRIVRLRRLSTARGAEAIARLQRFRVSRYGHQGLLARCWQLHDNLTPYDASYVALAEALRIPLLTSDRRLAQAPGIRCEVELVT
jgi:predicted nucleic acid-binding protein